MELKLIKTKKEYKNLLAWVDEQFERKLKPSSPEGQQLQIALLLVKQYEDQRYQFLLPMPYPPLN